MNKLEHQMRQDQEDDLKKRKSAIGENEHSRPSNVTWLIQAAKAKGIEKNIWCIDKENE